LRHVLNGCFAAMLMSVPMVAQATELYDCRMRQDAANNNWIASQIVVNYDSANGEVIVFDPIIQHFTGAPVKGKVEIENKKRVTFAWRLKGTKDIVGQGAEFVYRLTVLKKDNKATMTAQALNYAGPFSAIGTCTLTTK
jgi:hypothetical protein